MCGIAGSHSSRAPIDQEVVEGQLQCLMHRGPDAWGVHVGARGIIGQTRLSIIDLVTGDPPITDESGQIGVALNGEIYNFAELRAELAATGHRFATTGDTEVIAHLAETCSPVALAEHLDGMFAFAVLDSRTNQLILARDRFGKKPLYYWTDGTRLVFGSEIKAVLADPRVPRRLDPDAITAYLTFGYVPTPRTFFEGIRSVRPGHVLVVEADGSIDERCYWRPPLVGVRDHELALSLDEAAVLVHRLLEEAVAKRLVADVPLGAFLSGGIDSSAVVACMARLTNDPVRTFTIGFDDTDGFDERKYASLVARSFGTAHTEFVVHPDMVELVDELAWHFDQPFADSSALPTYLLAKETKAEVTVALCGDGGDEVFAGYERFSAAMAVDRWSHVPRSVRTLARLTADRAPGPLQRSSRKASRFMARADAGMPDALRAWISYVPEDQRNDLLPQGSNWAVEDYRAVWASSEGAPLLNRILDINIRTYLLDDLLPKVDRASMAHGLEVRTPFLDRDLVAAALRLPPATRLRGFDRKRVLKRAFRDVLPKEITNRPKRGFGVPVDRWFREDLAGLLSARLGPKAELRSFVSGQTVDRLLAEHASGAAHGQSLWTLLMLELFLEKER